MTALALPQVGDGKTPDPGIYADIPNEVYHALPGVSKSMLDKLDESPAHLRDAIDNPVHEQTMPMMIGSATHCAVLQPDKFEDQYIVMPDIDGRTSEARAFREAAKKKGKQALKEIEARWIKAIATRVRDSILFRQWSAKDPLIENSVIWEMDGYLCRARPDMIVPDMNVIVDLKTTALSCDNFPREIFRRNYDWQAYWYLKAAENVGIKCDSFMIVAAHKARPFLVSFHEIHRDSEAFAIAADECEVAFETYKNCMRTGLWPGYSQDPIPVQVPRHHETVVVEEEPF